MASKNAPKSTASRRGTCYDVTGDRAVLKKRHCPRCGPGVLMAEHADRTACGRCGYTEFRK